MQLLQNTSKVHFPSNILKLTVFTPVLSSFFTPWNNQTFYFKTKLLSSWKTEATSHSLTYTFGVSKMTPRLSDRPKGLTGLKILSPSWLWFITVKGYKEKSVKGKAHRANFGENKICVFKSLLPVESYRTCLNFPSNELW